MERVGYHPHKTCVQCVRERVGWNVTSDRSSANFAPICQNKTEFKTTSKCQCQTETMGYYLFSPFIICPSTNSEQYKNVNVCTKEEFLKETVAQNCGCESFEQHHLARICCSVEFGNVDRCFWRCLCVCVCMSDYLAVFEVLLHMHWSTLSKKQTVGYGTLSLPAVGCILARR